ncbi:MAG: hypothetical protein ACI9VT_000654 [Psychroserpens sp.]|jgi:hypothetical protein
MGFCQSVTRHRQYYGESRLVRYYQAIKLFKIYLTVKPLPTGNKHVSNQNDRFSLKQSTCAYS